MCRWDPALLRFLRKYGFAESAKHNSSVQGVVIDSTGASVPSAAITLTNVQTGIVLNGQTDQGVTGGITGNNLSGYPKFKLNSNQYTGRLDYTLNQRHSIFAQGSYLNSSENSPGLFPNQGSQFPPGHGAAVWDVAVGRGRRFESQMNRALDRVAGGWNLDVIGSFQKGNPINITEPKHHDLACG
jgi:hypothetical protein